ncbi:MAG: hypothetical protein ACE10O_03710 [Candidatus Acidiferrales bacterium]
MTEEVDLPSRGWRDYDGPTNGKRFLVNQIRDAPDAPLDLGRLRIVLN